jgi:hypothetical protein
MCEMNYSFYVRCKKDVMEGRRPLEEEEKGGE